jgi:uncharacterized protein
MMLRNLCVILALFVGVSAAYCDEASRLAKASEVLRLAKSDQTMRQGLGIVAEQMKSGFIQQISGVQIPPEMEKEVAAFQDKIVAIMFDAISWEKLEPTLARMYADTYTESQLDGIIAFYKSEAGQAMVTNAPVLMAKSSAVAQQRIQDILPQLQTAMDEFRSRVRQAAADSADGKKK